MSSSNLQSAQATTAPADPPGSSAAIRALIRQRRFGEALETAEARLTAAPTDRDALLFRAMALRYLGRIPDALKALEQLGTHHPRFSRLYEERGQCYVVLRQAEPAIQCFNLALRLNSALPASLTMLEGLYRLKRQDKDAELVARDLATLRQIPPEVVSATSLFLDGDLEAAESSVRAFLLQHGDQIEAMRLLARIGVERKVYDDAELLLRAVLEAAPDYKAARADYAQVLVDMHREPEAIVQLEQLMREDPENRLRYQSVYATACVGVGDHDKAIRLYEELLDGSPGDADVHLSIAHALKTMGRREQAIASYRKATETRRGFGDA